MALFLEKTDDFVTLAAKIAIFLGQNMHLTSKTCVLPEKFVTHGLISREIRVTVLGAPYNYRRFFTFPTFSNITALAHRKHENERIYR